MLQNWCPGKGLGSLTLMARRHLTFNLDTDWCVTLRYARGLISGPGSTLFEELGLYYIGPIDGHNLGDLIGVLRGESTTPE